MDDAIIQINSLLTANFSFTEDEKNTISSMLSHVGIDLERTKAILSLIIDNKLDKSSVIAFINFQLFKIDSQFADEIAQKLSCEERSIIAYFKTIKDINNLTLSEEAEDVRRMFIVMSNDLRVVIIKLFGVYYDISVLENPLDEESQLFIKQVKEIHIPLAERLGFDKLKQNLYDNVIRLENPEEFYNIKMAIESKKEEHQRQLELVNNKMQTILDDLNIKGEIVSRIKNISSIFNKLHNKNLTLDQIYDILAMRIIVNSIEECYEVFGRIHGIYKPIPGRVKDYIANPKPNGYQSLHTTVIVENQHPMEIQIRTLAMHRESEYGVYSHWLYKENKTKQDDLDIRMTWFRQTIENAKNMSNEDFIETLKGDLYAGLLVVQTPKGRVMEFPEGSTVIDFAYAIHSDIGNKCVGAKINGKLKPFTTELKNGDIVEIITNPKSKGPSRDWIKSVKTSSARNKIKAFFKTELKEENIRLGKSMLGEAIQAKGFASSQLLKDKFIEELLKRCNVETMEELYASLGAGSIASSQVMGRLISFYNNEVKSIPKTNNVVNLKRNKDGILVDGDSGMMVRFAGCCSPIEGDDIIGYISRGRGVTIHRRNCPNLAYLENERLIDAQWHVKEDSTFIACLKVIAQKTKLNIMKLTTLLTGIKYEIKAFDVKEVGDEYACNLVLEVKNKNELNDAITTIRNINGIVNVYRSER